MTPEAQRIAIAEACGWTDVSREHPESSIIVGLKPNKGIRWGIPDYLNDLNAMHEAEKTLSDLRHVWDRYCDLLGGSLYHCAHATAAQRAEAFLRTLSLWQE